MQDGKLHLRALGATDAGNNFLQREFLRGLPVDGQNNVARFEPGPIGGGVLNGSHHRNLTVLHGNFYANTKELAGGGLLHFFVFFGVHKGGVRVKALKHAFDRAIDKVALRHITHVITLHQIKNLAEALERIKLTGGFLGRFLFFGALGSARQGDHAAHGKQKHKKAKTDKKTHNNDLHADVMNEHSATSKKPQRRGCCNASQWRGRAPAG